MRYIYGLVDPRDKQICYVGQTDDVDRRHQEHCDRKENTRKGQWIQELRRNKLSPLIVVLEQVQNDMDINYREKWWIVFAENSRWKLTNTSNPCTQKANFGDMFSSYLKQEYESFAESCHQYSKENSTLILITRAQFGSFILASKILVAIVASIVIGFGAGKIEYTASPNLFLAIFMSAAIGAIALRTAILAIPKNNSTLFIVLSICLVVCIGVLIGN